MDEQEDEEEDTEGGDDEEDEQAKALRKAAILQEIAATTNLPGARIGKFLDALTEMVQRELSGRGPGVFTLPAGFRPASIRTPLGLDTSVAAAASAGGRLGSSARRLSGRVHGTLSRTPAPTIKAKRMIETIMSIQRTGGRTEAVGSTTRK